MLENVYIIRYEETYSDGSYSSGIYGSEVYKDKESVEHSLDIIKEGEIEDLIDEYGLTEEDAKSRIHGMLTGDGIVVEYSDCDTCTYIIEELDFYE